MENLANKSPSRKAKVTNKMTQARIEEVAGIKEQIQVIDKLRVIQHAKLFQAKLAAADDLMRNQMLDKEETK